MRRLILAVVLIALCSSALALLNARRAAAAEACANAAVRAAQGSEALPDCRAYEEVTPAGKGGVDVTGTAPFVKAAQDGDGITYLSNVSRAALREYTPTLALRGASDWSSAGLLPPPPAEQLSELVGVTPDLALALDTQRQPGEGEAEDLAVRLAASGELQTIVPFTPSLAPHFVGASEDDSLLVFESPAVVPGAGPALAGGPNLYLWDRSSGEVRLIGLLNDGRPPSEGAIGGPYDWLQGLNAIGLARGGASRNYYTQDEHAVAADGAAVYFTAAGTGGLYLRRNPASAQSPLDSGGGCADPSLACTVAVSASQKQGAEPQGPAPAAFAGAAADGKTAFFTSPEELTDDASTGPESAPPHISRADLDGDPSSVEPAFVPVSATGLAIDGSHLYWVNPTRGSIGRANLDGSGVEEDFIAGLDEPRWLAVSGEYVYWSESGSGGSIGRASLDGDGAPEAEFITGAGRPQGIAVSGEKIYWANDAPASIGRANLDGSGAEPSFHLLHSSEVPQGIAVNGTYIYWTENEPSSYVSRANLDGSHEAFQFAGGSEELRGIALDGEHVYWTVPGSGAIGRANLELGEFEPHFIAAAERPNGLAFDAAHLYWSTAHLASPGNDLYRYEAESGKLTDLTSDPGDPNGAEVQGVLGISTEGDYIYFAANGVLASGSNANGETALPGTCHGRLGSTTGSCNLYVAHEGAVEFIARLQADGSSAESDAMDWAPTPTGLGALPSFQPTARVSADGRTLLFRSRRQLSAYPNAGTPELYRYRAGEPGLICVSCDPDGAAPAGAATLTTLLPPTRYGPEPAGVLTRNLSASGDRVFFESVDPLVEADRNGEEGCPAVGFPAQAFPACQDVYEWEAPGTGSCSDTSAAGCTYLLSGAKPGQPAFFADASRSGDDAFIFTAAPLAGRDRDELTDVYDVRVDGGNAAPEEAPPACAGEECRPPASPAPAIASPATGVLGPPQAPRRRRRCRRAGRRHSRLSRRCSKSRRSHR